MAVKNNKTAVIESIINKQKCRELDKIINITEIEWH